MGSWVDIDPTSPFSLDNLPFGIASTPNKGNPHVVTAIGSYVVSIGMVLDAINKDEDNWGFDAAWMSLLPGIYDKGNLLSAVDQPTLGQFAILGRAVHNTVRSALRELLSANTSWGSILRDNSNCRAMAIVPQSRVRMYMPFSVANYTDFYAGYYHARTVGAMFRGEDKALQPNYLHLPVAYHGRASSVAVSGTPVRRPVGQILLEGDPTNPQASPVTLPTQKLDLELELGCVVGFGTQLGERVPVGKANDYIFGYVLLNDWSARDIQKWEYVPLGPFNGKNFVTMVSPWVVAADALERFRVKPSVELGVEPQEYLRQKEERVFDIQLEVELTSELFPPFMFARKYPSFPC
jgi:fumarylacetoacetase